MKPLINIIYAGNINGTAHLLNAIIACVCFMAVLYGYKARNAELDRFIASNQLEEPIATSLVARKTLGTLLDGCER